MDDARFDHLTRLLGTVLTRRRSLAIVAGGISAALPAQRLVVAAGDPVVSCRPGLDRCGSACCAPDARCRNGACEVQSGPISACFGEGEEIGKLESCFGAKKCCGNLTCVEEAYPNIIIKKCEYVTCKPS